MRSPLFFLAYLLAVTVSAEQILINDYEDARNNYFYDQLYVGTTGESLYCAIERPIQASIDKQRM